MGKFYTNVVKYGNSLCVRGYEDNEPFSEKVKYSPTMFVNCKEETKYKDIYGKSCLPIHKDNMKEMDDYLKNMKSVSNQSVLGMENYVFQYIANNYHKVKYDIDLIRTAIVDIEVYHTGEGFPHPKDAEAVIDAITHYDTVDDTYYVFGLKPWDRALSELDCISKIGAGKDSKDINLTEEILDKVKYRQFPTEQDLLIGYLQHWTENYPDAVTGWNSDLFDFPYIAQRISKILGDTACNRLSPWGKVYKKDGKDKFENEILEVNIMGISQLDYMELYTKFGYRPPRAFYNLDHISDVELGQAKLEFNYNSYREFSDGDYQKYIDYNIKDVFLVKELDKKLALISLVIGLGYDSGMNWQEAFSPVKMWDSIIFNKLKEDNIVVPKIKHHEKIAFEGAYVKPPTAGFYKWIMSFDLTSLYPMLINQYNISPETIISNIDRIPVDQYVNKRATVPDLDLSTAANGMQYTKKFKGVIPTVVLDVFNSRKYHKGLMQDAKKAGDQKEMILQNTLQMSKKISINAAYGALGNIWFRYYDLRNAEAITISGQLSIKWIERKLNEYFNGILKTDKDRCIAIDTDSVYFYLDDLVEKYFKGKSDEYITEALDKFSEQKIQKYINNSYEELAEYMNAYENKMNMDREVIARTGFWTKKKRYALDVMDIEGYRYSKEERDNTENMKILGLETQKSSTPKLVQDKLKDCITIILREDNKALFNLLEKFEREFKLCDYNKISGTTGVNGLDKYSDKAGFPIKGAQMHVKGALAFNREAKRLGEPLITNGDKIGVLFLKEPNRLRSPAIGFPQTGFPKSFDKEYILSVADYYKTYNKIFLAPLKLMTNVVDWETEDTVDITDFFA